MLHGENDFVKISTLTRYRSENNFVEHKNNYIEISSLSNAVKSFDITAISLSVLYNYFDGSTKLFSDLYLIKFLNIYFSKTVLFCVLY